MKGLLKFFEKILRNEGKLYERENLMIFGIKESLFVTLFSIFMLAFPRCRAILKWITYIGVFVAGMSACGVLFDNIFALSFCKNKSFSSAKNKCMHKRLT